MVDQTSATQSVSQELLSFLPMIEVNKYLMIAFKWSHCLSVPPFSVHLHSGPSWSGAALQSVSWWLSKLPHHETFCKWRWFISNMKPMSASMNCIGNIHLCQGCSCLCTKDILLFSVNHVHKLLHHILSLTLLHIQCNCLQRWFIPILLWIRIALFTGVYHQEKNTSWNSEWSSDT